MTFMGLNLSYIGLKLRYMGLKLTYMGLKQTYMRPKLKVFFKGSARKKRLVGVGDMNK